MTTTAPTLTAFPSALNGYAVRAFIPAPNYSADAFCVVVDRHNEFVTAYWRPDFGSVWSHGHYGFTTEAEAIVDAITRTGVRARLTP